MDDIKLDNNLAKKLKDVMFTDPEITPEEFLQYIRRI
jgi:hypothetical protein